MYQRWVQDQDTKISISTAFKYTSENRALILQAKINNSDIAIAKIKEKMLKIMSSSEFVETKFDLIIPCPSSPWSRIMGRTDLAFEIANSISNHFNLPLKLPPYISYWNLKKRSFNKHKNLPIQIPNRRIQVFSRSYKIANKKILLVDDVSTTGWTMIRTSKFFCSSNCFHGIVFSGK